MTLEEYIKELQEFSKNNPECKDLTVVKSGAFSDDRVLSFGLKQGYFKPGVHGENRFIDKERFVDQIGCVLDSVMLNIN